MNTESSGPSSMLIKADPDSAPNPLVLFAVRIVIVLIAFIFAMSWLLDFLKPDEAVLRQRVHHIMENHSIRLKVNGLLSNNPSVNWEVSIELEKIGKIPGAVDEIIIAIGMLEKANARNELIEPYRIRLESLKKIRDSQSALSITDMNYLNS